MNGTITIDNQDYDVLTTWKGATHAQLVTGVKTFAQSPFGMLIDGGPYSMKQINDNNIQPLKLIERVPVEFSVEFALIGSHWYPLHTLDDAQGSVNNKKMKFRCVQITEEA